MVVEHSVTEVVLFCVLIIVCLWCDLHAHQADKPVSARNAAIWSCIWVGLALVFAGYIGYSFGSEQVQLFLTGYLLEKSLSVDNLFVIMAIFSSFAVKDAFQHRVLYYGVLGALVLRLIFVAAGSSLVAMFGPYALASFGIFVLWDRVEDVGSPCTAARRKKSSTTPSTGPSGTPSASSPCTTSSAVTISS